MNEDLKAYIDGELPPDAAERLRAALAVDPVLRQEAERFRQLGEAVRGLPLPDPVGQAATLAALNRRPPLWRVWTPALAGCAAVVAFVAFLPSQRATDVGAQAAVYRSRTQAAAAPAPTTPPAATFRVAEPPEKGSLDVAKPIAGFQAEKDETLRAKALAKPKGERAAPKPLQFLRKHERRTKKPER